MDSFFGICCSGYLRGVIAVNIRQVAFKRIRFLIVLLWGYMRKKNIGIIILLILLAIGFIIGIGIGIYLFF